MRSPAGIAFYVGRSKERGTSMELYMLGCLCVFVGVGVFEYVCGCALWCMCLCLGLCLHWCFPGVCVGVFGCGCVVYVCGFVLVVCVLAEIVPSP